MKINKSFYFAIPMVLTACGNSNQTTNEQSASTEAVSTNEEDSAADGGCNEKSAYIGFSANENPFHVIINTDNIEKEIERLKKFTKAATYNDKTVDVKFKEYQAGENNAEAFIADEYRDEWTGVVYESTYKPKEGDAGFLFTDEYIKSHRIASKSVDEMARLSADDGDFISEHYPNLRVARALQTVYLEDGDAKIFTVQFEPSGNKTLAINVFVKSGKYFVNEEWGSGDQYSTWNVDDEGEYHYPDFIAMVANDKSHYDLYYTKAAIESFTVGKYHFKQDSIVPTRFACYYQTIDYQSKIEPNYWNLKSEWKNAFEGDDNCAPKEYAVVDLNNDGCKEVIARDKANNRIAVFKFQNGNLALYDCNYSIETSSTISFDIYKNGVISSGGVSVLSIKTVSAFTSDEITRYVEIMGGPTIEYKKSVYGDNTDIKEKEFETEASKLKDQVTDLESFKWVEFKE